LFSSSIWVERLVPLLFLTTLSIMYCVRVVVMFDIVVEMFIGTTYAPGVALAKGLKTTESVTTSPGLTTRLCAEIDTIF